MLMKYLPSGSLQLNAIVLVQHLILLKILIPTGRGLDCIMFAMYFHANIASKCNETALTC